MSLTPTSQWFDSTTSHHFMKLLFFITILLTALVSFSQSLPERFIIVGDTRGSGGADVINTSIVKEIVSEITNHHPSFVIVPGDLVYVGSLSIFQTWRNLFAPVRNMGIPVYPVLGNHDANDVASYISVFGSDIPDNGPTGEINRTFFAQYNNTLVVGLDQYVTSQRVNQTWLNSVLNSNKLTHVFTFGHNPAFKVYHTDCLDDYPANRDAFLNSLTNVGSRIYFCGHDHFYDRLKAGNGVMYQIIAGNGGAPLKTGIYAYDGNNTTWNPVKMYHNDVFGYTVVDILNNTVTITPYKQNNLGLYKPANI